MAFGKGPKEASPPRSPRKRSSVIDQHDDCVKLKAVILHGKIAKGEEAWVIFKKDDPERFRRKNFPRVAKEHFKKLLSDKGLDSDYDLTLYKTLEGSWCLSASRQS
jgi:hypothetical protein